MKVQFPQSFDFNQMLVFSVFGHLLFLTVVLFFPKPVLLLENIVVPAFRVSLVSEPTGFKSAALNRSKAPVRAREKKKSGVEKKRASKKPVKLKKPAMPVEVKKVPAVKPPKSNGILAELNKLEAKIALATPSGKTLVEELDQVARLEKPRIKPAPAKPVKRRPVAEETFRGLEVLKDKKVEVEGAVPPAPLHQDVLENFEKSKIEESFPVTLQAPARDLLKELEQVAKLDVSPVPGLKTQEPVVSVESIRKRSESYDSIYEKLDSFAVESEPIKVEVSRAQLDSSSFRSKLRALPKASHTTDESGVGDSYVFTEKEGLPGANAQSLYVGTIQDKIYKNWREPLAEEHNQEAVVSFFIFPGGNIDKPFIKKSSGVEALDTLAVRAVLDSVPFPVFPKGLKMSNLHVNIYFKYVPKDE